MLGDGLSGKQEMARRQRSPLGGSALPALKVCMWAVSPSRLVQRPLPDFPSVPPLYTVLLGNLTPIEALFDVSS